MCAAWDEAMGQAQPDMFESCEPPAQAAALALFIGKTKGAHTSGIPIFKGNLKFILNVLP
jgi:hypothetical protein